MSNNQQTEKPHVKIERWEIVGGAVLFGFALNPPRLGSCMVRTSSIVKVDMQARTVETLNTVYELVGDSAAALRAASKRETIHAPQVAEFVTRDQVIQWARLADFPVDALSETMLGKLGDFAVFARTMKAAA